jgi:hypothetical protein
MAMQGQQRDVARHGDDQDYPDFDALLDEALRLTFPASDPIAIYVDRSSAGAKDRVETVDRRP